MKEKKFRVEDTLAATRAALEEGIVCGGGIALIQAVKALDESKANLVGDEKVGFDIIKRALEEPIRQIAENAGVDGAVIADKAKSAVPVAVYTTYSVGFAVGSRLSSTGVHERVALPSLSSEMLKLSGVSGDTV